jgi:hypothetical protein
MLMPMFETPKRTKTQRETKRGDEEDSQEEETE